MVTPWKFLHARRARDRTSEGGAAHGPYEPPRYGLAPEGGAAHGPYEPPRYGLAPDDEEPGYDDAEQLGCVAVGVTGGRDAVVRVRRPSVKLSLEVTPEVNDVLRELVEQTHASGKSEVLRKAIALMKVAVDAKKEGKKIGIAEKDQPLATEIVGLGF